MKKFFLTLGMTTALATSLIACGGSQGSESTASKESVESQKETTEESVKSGEEGGEQTDAMIESSEAVGENTVSATVQRVNGDTLVVEMDDGQSMSFRIGNAEISKAWELMGGDQVEIGYDGEDPVDGMAVRSVVVSVPYEFELEAFNENPSFYGRIERVSDEVIVLRASLDPRDVFDTDLEVTQITEEDVLGDSYSFRRADYELIQTKGGVEEGAYAEVYYVGNLEDSPLSFCIRTADMEEEDLDSIGLKGTVETVEEGIVYIKANAETTYKFQTSGDDTLLKKANDLKGQEVIVYFSDSLMQRVATLDNIEAA